MTAPLSNSKLARSVGGAVMGGVFGAGLVFIAFALADEVFHSEGLSMFLAVALFAAAPFGLLVGALIGGRLGWEGAAPTSPTALAAPVRDLSAEEHDECLLRAFGAGALALVPAGSVAFIFGVILAGYAEATADGPWAKTSAFTGAVGSALAFAVAAVAIVAQRAFRRHRDRVVQRREIPVGQD